MVYTPVIDQRCDYLIPDRGTYHLEFPAAISQVRVSQVSSSRDEEGSPGKAAAPEHWWNFTVVLQTFIFQPESVWCLYRVGKPGIAQPRCHKVQTRVEHTLQQRLVFPFPLENK